jgi:hypothetical protein
MSNDDFYKYVKCTDSHFHDDFYCGNDDIFYDILGLKHSVDSAPVETSADIIVDDLEFHYETLMEFLKDFSNIDSILSEYNSFLEMHKLVIDPSIEVFHDQQSYDNLMELLNDPSNMEVLLNDYNNFLDMHTFIVNEEGQRIYEHALELLNDTSVFDILFEAFKDYHDDHISHLSFEDFSWNNYLLSEFPDFSVNGLTVLDIFFYDYEIFFDKFFSYYKFYNVSYFNFYLSIIFCLVVFIFLFLILIAVYKES